MKKQCILLTMYHFICYKTGTYLFLIFLWHLKINASSNDAFDLLMVGKVNAEADEVLIICFIIFKAAATVKSALMSIISISCVITKDASMYFQTWLKQITFKIIFKLQSV